MILVLCGPMSNLCGTLIVLEVNHACGNQGLPWYMHQSMLATTWH